MSLTASPAQETVAPARRPQAGALSTSTLRHASDDRLVALTRGGSERAFAEIMRRYQRPLQFYCLHMVGAPRAEDAVQQAFMQAFVALRDGERREIALRPWLYRITRNCAIDLLRKQPYDHDELDPDFDGMAQPPGVLEQKEELARVVAAIQALPERQRRALTLRELEGRSYGEISAELGHTDSGVRQLIFRARTALRNLGAFILPVGSLRWRLLGSPSSSSDPHQIAAAATVSSGGSQNVLQAAVSVVVTTLALLGAGPSQGAHHGDRAAGPADAQADAPFGKLSIASGGASAGDGRRARAGYGADAAPGESGGAGAVPVPVPIAASYATPPPAPSEPVGQAVADDQPTERATPEADGEQPEKLEALDASSGTSTGSGGATSDPAAATGVPSTTTAPAPVPSAAPQPAGTTGSTAVKKPKAPTPPRVIPPKPATPKKPVPPRPPLGP
jgi:RNA polymerase sigma factor (sigma-70 family)